MSKYYTNLARTIINTNKEFLNKHKNDMYADTDCIIKQNTNLSEQCYSLRKEIEDFLVSNNQIPEYLLESLINMKLWLKELINKQYENLSRKTNTVIEKDAEFFNQIKTHFELIKKRSKFI